MIFVPPLSLDATLSTRFYTIGACTAAFVDWVAMQHAMT